MSIKESSEGIIYIYLLIAIGKRLATVEFHVVWEMLPNEKNTVRMSDRYVSKTGEPRPDENLRSCQEKAIIKKWIDSCYPSLTRHHSLPGRHQEAV